MMAAAAMSAAQRASADELIAGPRKAVLGPFIPLLRSPELMARVGKVGEYLRFDCVLDVRIRELSMCLVARQLIAPHPVVVAAPGYLAKFGAPESPADLGRHNCLLYDRAGRMHRSWRFCRDDQWVEVSVQGNRHVDDASLARQWALAGAGILMKSPLEQLRDMAEGRLVRLLSEWKTEAYPLYAVLPSGRFIPRRLRVLIDHLAAKFEGMQVPLTSL